VAPWACCAAVGSPLLLPLSVLGRHGFISGRLIHRVDPRVCFRIRCAEVCFRIRCAGGDRLTGGAWRRARTSAFAARVVGTGGVSAAGTQIMIVQVARASCPFRSDEFSRLRNPGPRREGLQDPVGQRPGGFKVVHYDQGGWERTLQGRPAPIPFE
jgi:hypothetical protein